MKNNQTEQNPALRFLTLLIVLGLAGVIIYQAIGWMNAAGQDKWILVLTIVITSCLWNLGRYFFKRTDFFKISAVKKETYHVNWYRFTFFIFGGLFIAIVLKLLIPKEIAANSQIMLTASCLLYLFVFLLRQIWKEKTTDVNGEAALPNK